jgi:hypothetical protein
MIGTNSVRPKPLPVAFPRPADRQRPEPTSAGSGPTA